MSSDSDFEPILNHLETELQTIRAGRAHPSMIEGIMVQAYGTTMPLIQLSTITVPDARTIAIQPWDKSLMKECERALHQANLGAAPVNDGTTIRLTFPPLTEERRREYQKILHQKLEQARVAVRKIREERVQELRASKQSGSLSEDNSFTKQKELQKTVDTYIEAIDERGKKKEEELLTV